MKIEPEDIKGFQRLWEEQFQESITEDEAQEKAVYLLEMMKVVYRPLPKARGSQQLSILNPN